MPIKKNGIAARGKVISFEPGSDFFYRRGSERLEKNDLLDAIFNYRQALRRDPKNVDCRLAIAEVLTEMQHYDESNRILLALLSHPEKPTECYFGMACNFIGTQDYNRAYECLESYLSLDPEGDYAAEAIDILDAMDDGSAMESMWGVRTQEECDAAKQCERAKFLLESGCGEEALDILEDTAQRYPNDDFVQNNLSMGYFCERRFSEAIDKVMGVLRRTPNNVQSHCNLALYYSASRKEALAEEQIEYIKNIKSSDPDDLNRIAVVLAELDRYEVALPFAKQAYSMLPYDEGVIHRLGTCYYWSGDYQRARECYDRLLKMNEDDTIAQYYRSRCQRTIKTGELVGGWMNFYQVPYEEMFNRVKKLNHILAKPYPELEKKWQEDHRFRALIKWGLALSDPAAKRALLSILGSFGDQEAEYMLRDFQLDPAQPDDLKREVFGILKHMHAEEPYLALLDGELAQSRINVTLLPNQNVPTAYRNLLKLLLENVISRRPQPCVEECISIYEKLIGNGEDLPRMTRPQISAMAAAIEWTACRNCEESMTTADALSYYNVTRVRLNNALKKVEAACAQKDE